MPRKRGRGRPSLGADARSEVIRVRVRPALLSRIKLAAGDQPLSAWGLEQFEAAVARRLQR